MSTSSNPAAWELVQAQIDSSADTSGAVPIPTIKAGIPESEHDGVMEEIHYAIGEGRLELLGEWPNGSVRYPDPKGSTGEV